MKIRTNNIMSLHSTVLGVLIVFMGILSACGGGSESSPTRAATPQSAEVPNATIQAVSGSTAVPGTWTGRASVLTVNTNWTQKTETINGKAVTYVFGGGNPPEVALSPAAYKATAEVPGQSYVVPDTEFALKALLSSDALRTLMTKCASAQITPGLSYPLDFDINKWMLVSKQNGRKAIPELAVFGDWLSSIYRFDEEFSASKLNSCFA